MSHPPVFVNEEDRVFYCGLCRQYCLKVECKEYINNAPFTPGMSKYGKRVPVNIMIQNKTKRKSK
jgi:hypothetical protein